MTIRFAKPHTLRYNLAKGKRLYLAWLRTSMGDIASCGYHLSGDGSGLWSYIAQLLAVRPALHSLRKAFYFLLAVVFPNSVRILFTELLI